MLTSRMKGTKRRRGRLWVWGMRLKVPFPIRKKVRASRPRCKPDFLKRKTLLKTQKRAANIQMIAIKIRDPELIKAMTKMMRARIINRIYLLYRCMSKRIRVKTVNSTIWLRILWERTPAIRFLISHWFPIQLGVWAWIEFKVEMNSRGFSRTQTLTQATSPLLSGE